MARNPELIYTLPPHMPGDGDTTLKVMRDVLIALLPATIAGILLFGSHALGVVVVSMASAAVVEALCVHGRLSPKALLGDGSALVAGLLFALILPPGIPPAMAAAGAAIAMLLGKHAFGGIGRNLFNPALVGRAVLMALWPRALTTWPGPLDASTGATPLAGGEATYLQLFLGRVPGSLGETSALLLLLGGLYLLLRGRIGYRIPVAYIGSVAVLAVLFGQSVPFHLFSGGLMIGALFMATDMTTSPVTPTGQVIFGLGCGVATMVIREFAALPEGVMYAILLMNALVPLLDRFFRPKTLGEA